MIDHVVIPNLRRRKDKWYFMLGALETTGFPMHKDFIIRVESHDGNDYKDDYAVRDAAIADGFEGFHRYDGYKRIHKALMAWNWTFNSCMRRITEMDENTVVLFLVDDKIPSYQYPFPRLKGIVGEVLRRRDHGEFLGMQLKGGHASCSYKPPTIPINSVMVAYGWVGTCDHSLVLTPKCAQILMDVFSNVFRGVSTIHDVILNISNRGQTDENYYKGFWHTIDHVLMGTLFFESDINH